jgi:small subunit ribosomal protein S2
VIADAVAEGLISRSGVATGDKGDKAAGEPLAAWERDLLEGEKKADAETTDEAAEKPAEAAAEAEAPAAEAPAAEAEAPAAEVPAAETEAPAAEAAPAAEGEQA